MIRLIRRRIKIQSCGNSSTVLRAYYIKKSVIINLYYFFYCCIAVASVIYQLIRLYFFLFFAVPGSPRGLSLHVQNQSFILLQWNPPEHINGIITGYQVTAQKLSDLTTAITGYTDDSSTEICFHHKFDPTAKYRISILAVNKMGKGPPVVSTFDLTAG